MSDCCSSLYRLPAATVRYRMCWPEPGESPSYLEDDDVNGNLVRLYDGDKPIPIDQ